MPVYSHLLSDYQPADGDPRQRVQIQQKGKQSDGREGKMPMPSIKIRKSKPEELTEVASKRWKSPRRGQAPLKQFLLGDFQLGTWRMQGRV